MADQTYLQEQERKAAENRAKIEALARAKVAERMREADQKKQQQYAQQRQADDRKRAEDARKRDRQQQEHRARAREYAKTKAAEKLKKEAVKAKGQQKEPEKQMHGASQGPTMRPSSGDKQRDALEMAAEMDHPGLTDGQKAELARQGVSMGEGFKNREEKRREEAAARESRKTPADKAEDRVWFKQGKSYEERQALEIKRDKHRVRQIEQGKNDVLMPRKEQEQVKQVQVREPEKAQAKAPAKAFEFAKEQEEPTKGGH